MKMYIAIKDWVPSGHAVNCAAHAGLIGFKEFEHHNHTMTWFNESFKKVTCAVSDAEFEALKNVPHCKVITESRLDNAEIGIVFAPRPKEEWPPIMKTLRLWK